MNWTAATQARTPAQRSEDALSTSRAINRISIKKSIWTTSSIQERDSKASHQARRKETKTTTSANPTAMNSNIVQSTTLILPRTNHQWQQRMIQQTNRCSTRAYQAIITKISKTIYRASRINATTSQPQIRTKWLNNTLSWTKMTCHIKVLSKYWNNQAPPKRRHQW